MVLKAESEQALGDGEGQGSLACYSPWGGRVGHSEPLNRRAAIYGPAESDMTERLNCTDGTGCHDLSFLNVQNIGIYI